jgi:hypothetical protein
MIGDRILLLKLVLGENSAYAPPIGLEEFIKQNFGRTSMN